MEKLGFFDSLEVMENTIPSYGYSDASKAEETDKRVRDLLISEVREMKETMFHVVQVGYELQRDGLSNAAEAAWDEVGTLLSRLQSSRLCRCGKKEQGGCGSCQEKAERSLIELVRNDRELIEAVKGMKASVRSLYKAVLEKGLENHFIRNINQIKNYTELVSGILAEREKTLRDA
jgi:hypothetical protein